MKLCLLGVENARNMCKNKMMNANFKKITRFLQLRKIILFATEEALDKKLSKYNVSKSLFDDQLEDLCDLYVTDIILPILESAVSAHQYN